MNNIKTWIVGEEKATEYLLDNGYKIVDKNCKIGGSELDIVAILPKNQQKKELLIDFKNRKSSDKVLLKMQKTAVNAEIKELNDVLVFVEVKARSSGKFGKPYEVVGKQKQHNIERGVQAYCKKFNHRNLPCRIDVISVVDDEIEHIKNAFESRY